MSIFKVYRQGDWPKKQKHFYPNTFNKRRAARNFCRGKMFQVVGLHIVHPDGKEEPYGEA